MGELKRMTEMPNDMFAACMRRICDPKVKLLLKQVNKPTFDKADEQVKVNPKFASPNIRVNLVPQKSHKRKDAAPSEEETKQQK